MESDVKTCFHRQMSLMIAFLPSRIVADANDIKSFEATGATVSDGFANASVSSGESRACSHYCCATKIELIKSSEVTILILLMLLLIGEQRQ